MIYGKKINNVTVQPIQHKHNNLPVKGSELFSEPYCNVFLCAKKKSGKSTVIYNIVKKCIGKESRVHIFASTAFSDPTYKSITDYLEKHEIDYEIFTSIIEGGQNQVSQIIEELNQEAEERLAFVLEEDVTDEATEPEIVDFGNVVRKKKRPKRKQKYLYPEHVFIFDDLGATLRDKSIDSLLKVNRHYKSKVIISSQYLNDLSPQARLQLDYVLLFKGLPMDKLAQVYKDVDLSIDFNTFIQYYNVATKQNFSFLYISVRDETFRINFSTELSIKK